MPGSGARSTSGTSPNRLHHRAIALGFGPAANRLLLYPASPFSRRSSRQVRLLIGMAELNVAFQSSFPALNGRPGADYDALERGPAPNAIALGVSPGCKQDACRHAPAKHATSCNVLARKVLEE